MTAGNPAVIGCQLRLAEFAARKPRKESDRFLRGHVPRKKHLSRSGLCERSEYNLKEVSIVYTLKPMTDRVKTTR